MSDSFSAFNLHSLSTPAPPKTIPFCICTHCTNLISVNHHLGDEGGSRSRGTQRQSQSQQSSRWSPTPAQLLVLEELYRQGTKTPTAEQIQQIASQLRRFGKIEGKNVFYWFQNHKARERQKRRRREMEEAASATASHREPLYLNMGASLEKHDAAGLRGTGYEVKERKKGASSSCCRAPAQQPVSPLETAESGPNGWTKFEERRLQILKNTTNTSISTSASDHRTSYTYCDDEEHANTRTLELFPLKRDFSLNESKSRFCASNFPGTEITSSQFFEFLPLKTEGN